MTSVFDSPGYSASQNFWAMKMTDMLPPLKPIPIKERLSILYVEYGQLDVLDGAFVVVDKLGVRTHIPIGGVACLMLEPGSRVSHAACALAARVGTLLVWVGEAGVRLYSAGQPISDQQEQWRFHPAKQDFLR